MATHEIRAGEVIRARDFRVDRIRADRDLLSTIVGGHGARALRGEIAVATIAENAVIPRGAVRAPAAGAGLRAMSIPIDPSKAVGGRLAAGDRVDVLFTDRSLASIIVTDAKVLAVDERGRGGIGESTSPFTLTIAVDANESLLVAAAIADGNISIAATTGAASSSGTAPQALGRTARHDGPAWGPVNGVPVPEPGPTEPTIALVFSPEMLGRRAAPPSGRSRRRARAPDRDGAVGGPRRGVRTLVVSHRWPALSRPLITGVHDRGRRVLGVFDPDEPQGRDHLHALGADAAISASSAIAEFVAVLTDLGSGHEGAPADAVAGLAHVGNGRGGRDDARRHGRRARGTARCRDHRDRDRARPRHRRARA